MKLIQKILSSRTVWAVVVLFLVAGVHAVQQFIPADLVMPIEGLLSALAIYFKLNPSQTY